jgi:hypothetical protein
MECWHCTEGAEELQPYVAFHAALLASYQRFVTQLATKVRTTVVFAQENQKLSSSCAMWMSQNQELSFLHPASAFPTPVTQPSVGPQTPACLWHVQKLHRAGSY